MPLHPPALERRIRALLKTRANIVEITDSNPEVIIFSETIAARPEAEISIETFLGRQQVMPAVAVSDSNFDRLLIDRLTDYARNLYLRGLKITNPDFQVHLELIPVSVTNCLDEEVLRQTCIVTELDPRSKRAPGNS